MKIEMDNYAISLVMALKIGLCSYTGVGQLAYYQDNNFIIILLSGSFI